ncbi:hypothetical protein GGI00_004018 [Coemansia sp. RSA 2681]|nr:hypothetical protein GGI00_004018 [Coemansia sp. RSA 2681]
MAEEWPALDDAQRASDEGQWWTSTRAFEHSLALQRPAAITPSAKLGDYAADDKPRAFSKHNIENEPSANSPIWSTAGSKPAPQIARTCVVRTLRAVTPRHPAIASNRGATEQFATAPKCASTKTPAAASKRATTKQLAAASKRATIEKPAAAVNRGTIKQLAATSKRGATEQLAAVSKRASAEQFTATSKRGATEQLTAVSKRTSIKKPAAISKHGATKQLAAASKRASAKQSAATTNLRTADSQPVQIAEPPVDKASGTSTSALTATNELDTRHSKGSRKRKVRFATTDEVVLVEEQGGCGPERRYKMPLCDDTSEAPAAPKRAALEKNSATTNQPATKVQSANALAPPITNTATSLTAGRQRLQQRDEDDDADADEQLAEVVLNADIAQNADPAPRELRAIDVRLCGLLNSLLIDDFIAMEDSELLVAAIYAQAEELPVASAGMQVDEPDATGVAMEDAPEVQGHRSKDEEDFAALIEEITNNSMYDIDGPEFSARFDAFLNSGNTPEHRATRGRDRRACARSNTGHVRRSRR